eukprot:361670-Chlamydomonas_euryale.AAC.1
MFAVAKSQGLPGPGRGVGGGPPSGFWPKKGQNAELKWGNERALSAVRRTRNREKGGGRPHSADQLLDQLFPHNWDKLRAIELVRLLSRSLDQIRQRRSPQHMSSLIADRHLRVKRPMFPKLTSLIKWMAFYEWCTTSLLTVQSVWRHG